MQIEIEPNKHLGVLFQPRSGSHVLRNYISEVSGRQDLAELFNPAGTITATANASNPLADETIEEIEARRASRTQKLLEATLYDITSDEINRVSIPNAIENLEMLQTKSSKNELTVFTIHPHGYLDRAIELFELLKASTGIQFIMLERADVLYAMLSIAAARNTGNWHNVRQGRQSSTYLKIPNRPMELSISSLNARLTRYVKIRKEIEEVMGPIPKIYYEQFQFNVGNIGNLFSGIPRRIVSVPVSKVGGNHKEFITNLNEVEDFYEQFVNENKEYFPQYFGKLPHIQIPACQGRQPRMLSSEPA